ncbi:hypothetical protein ACFVSN_02530 [Kitasatospora sp. NPDC057904]|uniref:hypothetical protein n=1 Tax=unclassified Kitasatospora TaxID=2633591 RepID=UPI0036DCEDC7
MVSALQNVAVDYADAYGSARFRSAVTDRPLHPDGSGRAVLADPEGNEFCVLRGGSDRAAPPS